MGKQSQPQEKNLVEKNPNVNLPAELNDSWGAETADSDDILIPKLLLMQGVSQAVADEKADQGDILDSVTLEKLGSGREKSFKEIGVVPLMATKTWTNFEIVDGHEEWRGEEPFTPQNVNRGKSSKGENGEEFKHVKNLNFYVMLEEQLKDPTAIPYLVSFRSTSYRVGQALSTHFSKCAKAAAMGKPVPPAATIFNLGAKKTSNENNTWWIYSLSPKGSTGKEDLKVCYDWYQILRKGAHKVDQSEFGESEVKEPAQGNGEARDF